MSTRGKVSIAVFVVAAFVAGVLFTTMGANVFGYGDAVATPSRARTLAPADEPSGPVALEDAFTQVAEQVNPAVVQILAEQKVDPRGRMNPLFREFFGEPFGGDAVPRQGIGSGFIIQPDGYLVTNNHVVEDADELSVRLFDGRTVEAEIVGTDPFSDLAVLKIDEADLPTVPFGTSEDLKTGQWVLAFGSPLRQNLNNSVTAGIVSAIGRLQGQGGGIRDYVQTDAAINPGNSGGPLVNLRGQVVGVNTAIISRTGGYQGIGFAIPASTARSVAEELIASGEVTRAFLGINYGPATPALIEAEGLPRGAAAVASVEDGSPADDAGLQPGDVIVAIDGEELTNYLQVGQQIANMKPGDTVQMTIDRDGERQTLTATLEEREPERTARRGPRGGEDDDDEMMEDMGLTLRDLTPLLARRLGLDDTQGVVITDINPASDAYQEANLRRGLVIEKANGKPITNVRAFMRFYRDVEPGTSFRLTLRNPRSGSTLVTALTKPSNGS
jgi:serine protease Do